MENFLNGLRKPRRFMDQ